MASMMISDEEKRWVVVGIAMQTIAPALRSFVKQGMESHYNIMDGYLSSLSTPCTLSTLTILQLSIDSTLKRLKFENVNDNIQTHGKQKQLYNYNVCSPVDLAKLYLPDYLAQFSSFDDSLDMTGILRLLGVDRPAHIFQSRNPLIPIQFAADEVRENVRNKWAHFEAAEWSEEFFKECFDKLEKLVKSLQLTDGVEKSTLEQLSDWEKRGCALCMGQAVDKELLSLIEQDVKELIRKYTENEAELADIQVSLESQLNEQAEMQTAVVSLQEQQEEHDERFKAIQQWREEQMRETKEILKLLTVFAEKSLKQTSELEIRVEEVEKDLAVVKRSLSESNLEERVKQLERNVKEQGAKEDGQGQPKSDDSETGCLTSADSEVKINEKEKVLRSKSTDGTQTSLQEQSSSKLQKKWQAFSQKTYEEIASACPGGTGENNLLLTGSHLEGKQEQRTFVNSDHHKIISVEVVYTRDQPNYDQGDFPRENSSYNDHLNQQQNENETQGERRQEANATDAASEQFGESSLSGRTTETHFYSRDTQGIEVFDTRDRQRNGQGDLPRENPSCSDPQNQQQNENETQEEHRQEANAIDAASEQFGEFLSSGTHIYSTDTQGNQVVDSPDQPRDDQGDLPPENASFSDSLNQQQNENVSETQGEHRQEANATDAASEQFEESSSSGRTSETHFLSIDTQGNRVVDSPDQPRDDQGDLPRENDDPLNQQQNKYVSETQGEHRPEANSTEVACKQSEESSSSGRTSETHFHSTDTQEDRGHEVFFNVYIEGEAEAVALITPYGTIPLKQYSPEEIRHWINEKPLYLPRNHTVFAYRYTATLKRRYLKRVYKFLHGDISSNEVVMENFWRWSSTENHHHDIFVDPESKQQSVFQGVLYFLDLLYSHNLHERADLSQHFESCKKLCNNLSLNERTEGVQLSEWIRKKCNNECITWYQSAFICSLLGQLQRQRHWDCISGMQPETVTRLLQPLPCCKEDIIPRQSFSFIKTIVPKLFEVSGEKGWLSFIILFANLLPVTTLLQKAKRFPKTYSEDEFNNLLERFVLLETRSDSDKILEFVIDHCPSINCLWRVFQTLSDSASLPEILRERFSQMFWALIYDSSSTAGIDLLRENFWESTPHGMRARLVDPFVEALHEQILQEPALSTKQLTILRSYISDKYICDSKQFSSLILDIARSKVGSISTVLVEMLNSEEFSEVWEKTLPSHRSNICQSLLEKKVGAHSQSNVVEVFKAATTIGKTYSLQVDHEVRAVLEKLTIKMLQNVDINTILIAFPHLDHSSQIVKTCYLSLLKEAVKLKGHTCADNVSLIKLLLSYLDVQENAFKKNLPSEEFQEVHLELLLELIEMPTGPTGPNWLEQILKTVLRMADVWLLVFRRLEPTSKLYTNFKVKTVLEALNLLRDAIELQNIRVTSLLNLSEREVDALDRLCYPTGNSDQNASGEFKISRAWKAAKEFQETFSKAETCILFVQKVLNGIADIEDASTLMKELNKKKEFFNLPLKDALNGHLWGALRSVVESAAPIQKLQDSTCFFNIARTFLTAKDGNVVTIGDSTTSTVQVSELLSNKVIPKFQQACNPLFVRGVDLAVDELGVLFRGIACEDDLQRELRLISNYFHRPKVDPDCARMLITFLRYPEIKRKVQALIPTLHAFKYETNTTPLEEFVTLLETNKMTLKRLCEFWESKIISELHENFDKHLTDIASVLAESHELLTFIEETASEDMVMLIDSVEELSEQFISEAIVSYLIDVHRFLKNILKDKPNDTISFFHRLKTCYDDLPVKKGMAAKIDECSRNVYSLRTLYKNLANRGEMTREIIGNALKKGSYQIGRNDTGSWDVLLTYKRQRNSTKKTSEQGGKVISKTVEHDACYKLTEIQDLRSRALLLVNIDSRHRDGEKRSKVPTGCSSADLDEFVWQVDQITEILNIATELHNSGHPRYKTFWVKLNSTQKIQEQAKFLSQNLEEWKKLLEIAQKKHFFLNYFHPDQLWALDDFLGRKPGDSCEAKSVVSLVHGLLRFIYPNVQKEALTKLRSLYQFPSEKETEEGKLCAIGKSLDAFFLPLLKEEVKRLPQQFVSGVVQPGELFVAVLEKGSVQTVQVVMSLYEQETGGRPEPSQILFCHSGTSWEEIQRLLRRSFQGSKQSTYKKLHCLANVESLPNDMQFDLVSAIKDCETTPSSPFLLSLVCCGGPHHHIADQFADRAHKVTGMPEVILREKFKNDFPDVIVVTSDLPGMGKTETIFGAAARKGKGIVTFPISGPFSRISLVNRLVCLKIRENDCLHLDIGEVDDPLAVDTFLFELVVVGMVFSGTLIYHLPTKKIYIEIANTLEEWLQDSLPITKCFKSLNIKTKGYDKYVVSQETSSPIQVVCSYLHAYDSGTLESRELVFSGPNKVRHLSAEACKDLLRKHFPLNDDTSYTIVENFLRVFADQLLKFSASPFLKPSSLRAMLGPSHDVRTRLLSALLHVSKEFAARSVNTCKSLQSEAMSNRKATEVLRDAQAACVRTAAKMVERVEGMIHWTDISQLLILFQTQQQFTIAALYRELSLVPQSIINLFKSQAVKESGKEFEDYSSLNQDELQKKLELLARTSATALGTDSSSKYALTPDNVLKMALILLRIRANIPVIIMGETGCGKTSLVRYLARTCDVPFEVFNFHAGVTEGQIVHFVENMKTYADDPDRKRQSVWIFLDEINACSHLGTINEIICHRTLRGDPLPSNLVFIAACNPYRLRPSQSVFTTGLTDRRSTDEFSRLVYRVHPLPETMMDYVWDYGSVRPDDEKRYIARMVDGIFENRHRKLLADLLFASQEFIRYELESPFFVSLRDVRRCIVLMNWFQKTLPKRNDHSPDKVEARIQSFYEKARVVSTEVRAVVLALAHCYQSRLQEAETRETFSKLITSRFRKEPTLQFQDESFEAIVRVEQEEYIARMELPEGTANNAALRENVFVILVCILNKIPVFVVGKPGCSKSLSMQVIRSNLRGKDSKDPFLKQLPQLFVVSYQGSESSTSEGILKVFEKARRYKHEGSNDVLPVVLLDEIGLAEVSASNPLKVLHSLLEPGNAEFPDVAVVGISNWCLDPAKMNRAIHLSRPEPEIADLLQTGQAIRKAQYASSNHNGSTLPYPDDFQLKCLAKSYHEYQCKQRHPNFHGLRDYYSLVKSLSSDSGTFVLQQLQEETKRTQRALQRNFGGLPSEMNKIQQLFLKHFHSERLKEETETSPVTELICDNLRDKLARHMMIITNGDSAIGILDQTLRNLDKETVTIFGSRFEEDQSKEYNYNILSRIILCMERECVLILRDLENIYGSLYAMLNQSYTVVGQKKHCRVALGPFSNPMCQIHDDFRCIVLIDEQRVDYTDPPFLNRFEKQLLRFSDVLNAQQEEIISDLGDWSRAFATGSEFQSHFNETDVFIGFNNDTLPSLVLHVSNDDTTNKDEIVEKCKEELMGIATPDGVLRCLNADLSKQSKVEVDMIYRNYFSKPVHMGLKEYMTQVLEGLKANSECQESSKGGLKLLVMTHSSIHSNVTSYLSSLGICQTEKLSAFKSEKQLAKQLQGFWTSDANILVLQCKPDLDAPHMLVAKHLIEDQRNTHISANVGNSEKCIKHVCLIVHVQRTGKCKKIESPFWQFSFQSGWKQVTIDTLEEPAVPITELLDANVAKLLGTKSFAFEIASDQLHWCFTRIKYQAAEETAMKEFSHLIKWLKKFPRVVESLKELVVGFLKERELSNANNSFQNLRWQVAVASDRQALVTSCTLLEAIKQYFKHLVREPLSKIVYFLEKECAWPKEAFSSDPLKDDKLLRWTKLLFDRRMVTIEDIPNPQGADSYIVFGPRHKLEFPFSSVFVKKVDEIRPLFQEDLRRLLVEDANLDEYEKLKTPVFEAQLKRFAKEVKCAVPQITEDMPLQKEVQNYIDDLFDLKTSSFAAVLSRDERINFFKAMLAEHIRVPAGGNVTLIITQLHCILWMNESTFNSALHLFVACQDIMPAEFKTLTSEFISTFKNMLFESKNASALGLNPKLSKDEDENTEPRSDDLALTFLEQLAETICRAIFPTASVVSDLQGPEQWQRRVSGLLSLISRLQLSVPAFHFLRICNDFVSLVLLPESLEPFRLYQMGENGLAHACEGYLDSPECFKMIDNLTDNLGEIVKNGNSLNEFRALFYTRCIDSNPDTPVLGHIISKISRSEDRSLIKLAGPVLHRIFVIENHFSTAIFENVLHNPSIMKDHPGLQEVSRALSSLAGKHELDCPFAVVCCDLISDVGFLKIDFSTISGSDNRSIKTLRKAMEIFKKPFKAESEREHFLLMCAMAYLRSFLGTFARLIVGKPNILTDDSEYTMLLRELDPVFSCDDNPVASVRSSQARLYFLRELRKNLPLYSIRKITNDSHKLPALKNFYWHHEERSLVGKLSFDPFYNLTNESNAKNAVAHLITEKNRALLLNEVISAEHSAKRKMQLAAAFTTWLYLVRSVRILRASEEGAIDIINDEVTNLPQPYVALVQRVTGRKPFQTRELNLSPESSPKDVHRAVFILHFCILLTSHYSRKISAYHSAFLSYLVEPRNSKDTFILALPNSPHDPFPTNQNSRSEGFPTKSVCCCGTLFIIKNSNDSASCPRCLTSADVEKCIKEQSRIQSPSTKGYISLPPSSEEYRCVRSMGPSCFRILHLLVHAALYGGIALGISDVDSLSDIKVTEGKGQNIAEFFFQHIVEDLSALSCLLNCVEEEVMLLLHRILEVTEPILSSGALCTTESMRFSFEKNFSDTISPLIHEFCVKRNLSTLICSEPLTAAEKQIEECDKPEFSDLNERNTYAPRLFRVTGSRSFNNLRAYYMHIKEEIKECHPLLGLFLDFHSRLHLIAHLNNLLVWSRMLETQISRRVSRNDASKATISDIIRGAYHCRNFPVDKERLRNAFENFKTSWEKLRPEMMNEMEPDVPHITELSPISLCLVERKGQGKFLSTALEVLQQIQNNFLEKVLDIAATGKCAAVKFLEREEGVAAVKLVHLQDAQKKEIIHYEWSDDILILSQCNTEYGHGKELLYDLDRIEKEMAIRYLLGKSYLSAAGGLREFTFSKELFHACKGIFDDLEIIVPQQSLTKDVKNGLQYLKERSLKDVQDLLEHMEIVLCLLKKLKVGNPDEPLVEFTDRWLSDSRPFPSSLLPDSGRAVLLIHVVALYHFLEDILAETTVEGIHDAYRNELPNDTRKVILDQIDHSTAGTHRLSLQSIVTALCRFIFRYISADNSKPEPGLSLSEHMLEPSLWPMEDMLEIKSLANEQWIKAIRCAFPEGLTLGHIHAALLLYQGQLEIFQEKKEAQRIQTAKNRRSTMTRGQKKKFLGYSFS